MRNLVALLVLAAAVAGPAAAQTPYTDQIRQAQAEMQLDLARQRVITTENQLTALETQLRAEQAIAALRAQASRPYIPAPVPAVTPPAPALREPADLATIPDDRLAASNAAVRAVTAPPSR